MKKKIITKIIAVDDHILVRDAIADMMDSFDGFEVVAKAANGEDFIQLLNEGYEPDIVTLDVNMPRLNGYETADWLRTNYPNIKVLVLTMYDSDVALIRFLKLGVRGFLNKDIEPGELKYALSSIVSHGYYYSHNATDKLAGVFKKTGKEKQSVGRIVLSAIEIEFLAYVCTELTYREIAEKMAISARAVDGYRDSLFDRLGVKNRVGLALYAVRNGIVSF